MSKEDDEECGHVASAKAAVENARAKVAKATALVEAWEKANREAGDVMARRVEATLPLFSAMEAALRATDLLEDALEEDNDALKAMRVSCTLLGYGLLLYIPEWQKVLHAESLRNQSEREALGIVTPDQSGHDWQLERLKTRLGLNPETYCLCKRGTFGEMVACDNDLCQGEWFHFECVQLSSKPKGYWYCPKCRLNTGQPNVMKPKKVFLRELEECEKVAKIAGIPRKN